MIYISHPSCGGPAVPIQFSVDNTTLYLLLAIFAAFCFFFWKIDRMSVTDMSRSRKRWALVIRLFIVLLLLFAIAGMQWVKRSNTLAVVYLADASRSIRNDQRNAEARYIQQSSSSARPGDTVGLITFGQDPLPHQMTAGALAEIRHTGSTGITNISAAMNSALALLPDNSARKIVLLSDGNENMGSALGEAPTLTARGVRIDTVLIPTSLKKEALVEKVIIPSRAKIGEPFAVRVVCRALNAQHARLILRREGQPIGTPLSVDLPTGRRVFTFETHADKPGFYRYEAIMETDPRQDTLIENNKGQGFTSVRGRPQVLYVSPTAGMVNYLRRSLYSQHIDVLYAPPSAMPTNPAAFMQFDSIILSDVPRAEFSQAQLIALQSCVRDFGVGFGMIGGVQSYGAGGWRNSPIEDVLPVSMEVKKQKRLPSVAVVLVIEDLEIPASVNMSKEASKALVDLLDPIDQVGVLDCNGYGNSNGGQWRVPFQHATDRAAIQQKIDTLENMGDPPSYDPYLVEAARVLQGCDAAVKHIIFLGDGDAYYEGGQNGLSATMRRIRGMGITVSSVATAADQTGIAYMAGLAKDGGGQSYVADQPRDLPRILLKDQQIYSAPPIIEEPFTPRLIPGGDVVQGIGSMPPLLGYNVASLRPTANVSIISHRNDPIFASWRYGLGRSISFLSDDKNRWGAHWLGWPGYGQFWAQAVRWTMRSFTPSDFQTQVMMDGSRGHIMVDAIDPQGKFVNRLNFNSHIFSPDQDETKPTPIIPLRQTGPGHYEAWFDAAEIGTYLVNVTREIPGKPTEMSLTGLVSAYSPEYRDMTGNEFLMTQLAQAGGGRTMPAPDQVFGSGREGAFEPIPIMNGLLFLAMLLFPIDVAIRRITLQKDDLLRAGQWIRTRGRSSEVSPDRAATPQLQRLMGASIRAKKEFSQNSGTPPLSMPESRTADPTAANPEVTPPVETDVPKSHQDETTAPVKEEEGAGMSRLMAAKLRAKEQQKRKDDGTK